VFADANTIYLGARFNGEGVWRSTNGGTNWENWSLPGSGFTNWVQQLALGSGGMMYAGTHGPGVFVTASGTSPTWVLRSTGLTGIIPWEVAADPDEPTRAYSVTDGSGLFRTTNGGQTWETMSVAGWEYGTTAVVIKKPVTNTVYIGVPNGLAYSTNNGETWLVNNIPAIGNNRPEAIAVHPVTSTILYVGLWETTSNTGSVWKHDNGWTVLPIIMTGTISPVKALVCLSGGTLLAGTQGAGVYRSTDGGLTWGQANGGLLSQNVNHLIFNGDKVWAGLVNGVAVSTDRGQTWANLSNGLNGNGVRRLARDPLNDNILYAATPNGLYHTLNAGQNWTLEAGPFAGVNVLSVGTTKDDDQTIVYAATWGGMKTTGASLKTQASTYLAAGVYRRNTNWHHIYLPLVSKNR
jgi:photosystem II stability/assembly factor-like uncharacterized protein